MPPDMRRRRALRDMSFFISMARREGLNRLFGSSRAAAISVSNGESMAVEMSSLSRVEVAVMWVKERRRMGRA